MQIQTDPLLLRFGDGVKSGCFCTEKDAVINILQTNNSFWVAATEVSFEMKMKSFEQVKRYTLVWIFLIWMVSIKSSLDLEQRLKQAFNLDIFSATRPNEFAETSSFLLEF